MRYDAVGDRSVATAEVMRREFGTKGSDLTLLYGFEPIKGKPKLLWVYPIREAIGGRYRTAAERT